MKYQQLDRNQKEKIKITIYNLKEQGLSYVRILEELKKQGIEISYNTVCEICKELDVLKGEKQSKLREDRIQEISDEEIYNLREQGLTYKRIVEELRKQGKRIDITTLSKRCNLIYIQKRKENLDLRKKITPESETLNEKIYDLRKKGLTYERIVEELRKQGIIMNVVTATKICNEMYALKEEKEPELRGNKIQEINDELIYNLREQGLTYEEIVEELEKQGIKISISAVYQRCKEIYNLKHEENWNKKRKITAESEQLDKEIYNLRKKGLSYEKVAKKLTENGTTLTRQRAEQRHKRFLKSNQQLAKAILNLMVTRKATMEQIQQIADYYGVDLEETMNSLDER